MRKPELMLFIRRNAIGPSSNQSGLPLVRNTKDRLASFNCNPNQIVNFATPDYELIKDSTILAI